MPSFDKGKEVVSAADKGKDIASEDPIPSIGRGSGKGAGRGAGRGAGKGRGVNPTPAQVW